MLLYSQYIVFDLVILTARLTAYGALRCAVNLTNIKSCMKIKTLSWIVLIVAALFVCVAVVLGVEAPTGPFSEAVSRNPLLILGVPITLIFFGAWGRYF